MAIGSVWTNVKPLSYIRHYSGWWLFRAVGTIFNGLWNLLLCLATLWLSMLSWLTWVLEPHHISSTTNYLICHGLWHLRQNMLNNFHCILKTVKFTLLYWSNAGLPCLHNKISTISIIIRKKNYENIYLKIASNLLEKPILGGQNFLPGDSTVVEIAFWGVVESFASTHRLKTTYKSFQFNRKKNADLATLNVLKANIILYIHDKQNA